MPYKIQKNFKISQFEDMTWPYLGCFFPARAWLITQTRTDRWNDQNKKLYIPACHFFLDCHSVKSSAFWLFVLILKQLLEYCNFPWGKKVLQLYLFLLWSYIVPEKQCFMKLLCELWSSKPSWPLQLSVDVKT